MGLRFQTKKEVKADLNSQSKILTEFYQDILLWSEQEMHLRDSHAVYLPWYGLCTNLHRYLVNAPFYNITLKNQIQSEMFRQFKKYAEAAGIASLHPFNKNEGEYRREVRENKTFLNIYRMRWVRDHAKGRV